ncbi:FAD-dependent oxidoreductase [Lactobacillus delbrueckii subsp. lactis]|uniref:FAD-dependent oxidoreductase n=1 Tax=Lactobacillus delbrueckii TaxID=1584 RepID=UPI001E396540|nr:FAD-dependent oxidoreductase [Lactobacillus delbrueckii]MCD9218312.1 FAD-dependent oxidoreductase [Lactobacillus delbrueckii subsp. lactis]
MNFDIVVVGAGASGISAALTTSECGAKVALLEKGNKFGGAGMFGAQGLFAVESRAQKEAGVKYSLKDAYEEIINYTHHSSNALMVKAILEESAATIDWMAESGLETELVTNTQEVHQEHPRTYHQFIDKFNGFKRVMNKFLESDGVLMTETSAEEIVQEQGKVTAVKANRKDDLYSMGERKATGDGLQMLKEAGGVSDYKRIFESHAATVYSKTDPKWHNASLFDLTNIPLLWVNREGKRFTNEDVVYDFALWGDSVYQIGGYYYFLFDQATVDYLRQQALDWTSSFERTFCLLDKKPMTYQAGPYPQLDQDLNEGISQGAVFKADSIQKLAEKIAVYPANLRLP